MTMAEKTCTCPEGTDFRAGHFTDCAMHTGILSAELDIPILAGMREISVDLGVARQTASMWPDRRSASAISSFTDWSLRGNLLMWTSYTEGDEGAGGQRSPASIRFSGQETRY